MSDIVKLVQGPLERIPTKSEQGAIYFATNECIHLALPDGEFKTYGHYLKVDTQENLPESANTAVLYFVKDKNSFYRFDEVWKQIESSELTDYVNQTKSDLTDYIDDTKDSLTNSINTTKTDLTNTINSTREALEKSISDTDTKLTKDIDDTDTNLRKLVTDTKSELTDAIDSAKTEAIETVLGKNVSADFDTLQEVAEWIQSDTTSSTKLVKRVSALEDDVEQLQEDVQTAQNTADDAYNGTRDNAGRLTSVEAEVKGIEQDYLTSDDYQNLENAIGEVCDIANSAIHNLTTATLLVENWDEETLTQTVTIDGILSDATRQVVNVKPYETSSNLIAKIDDNITAIALSENALTFTVASLPSSEMKFFVEYYPVNYIEEVIPEPEPPAEPEEPETPIEPETISFYLPNGYEFTGEEGMTWEEWVNSEYNTYNAYIQDNEVWFNQFPAPEGQLELPASGKLVDVVASDVIIAEQTYNYE